MTAMAASYPVQLEVDAAAPQNRLTIFFRLILVIPHIIVLYFLGLVQLVILVLAWFAIVFAGRFPADMLRFMIGVTHWNARANAYANLLTGRYPPFSLDPESDYPVRLIVPEQVEGRNRLTTFFRIILVIPHGIVLFFLSIIVGPVSIAAWLVALVIGRVPKGLHGFLAGFNRWSARIDAYSSLLIDDYPPFSFS